MLVEGPRYFSYEAAKLLAEKDITELTESEFISLLRSYNHVGAHEASAHVSKVAADIFTDSIELARWRSSCLLSSTTDFIAARAEHLARSKSKSTHAIFYLIALADYLVICAWGENVDCAGDVAEEPALLDDAAELLARHEVVEYFNKHLRNGGVRGGGTEPMSFKEHFEPLYRFKRYPLPDGA